MKDATTQIYAGLVRYADCGWTMSFAINTLNKNPYSFFICTPYRLLGKKGGTCTSFDVLYACILSRKQKAGVDTCYTRLHAN